MKSLIVFIPENFFIKYFVFNICPNCSTDASMLSGKGNRKYELLSSGRVRFRGPVSSKNEIIHLINNFKPDSAAIRVLYGGNLFKDVAVYDDSTLRKLEKLIRLSPLDISAVIKLIEVINGISPATEIKLFFETAFFSELPAREQLYALDNNLMKMEIRRFGYNGLTHKAVIEKMRDKNRRAKKIISICLDPVPEVAAIINGKPVMISSGATPVEGIPGDTTCGELDPGIIILIEEKKKLGAETINEIITKKSGLSAIAGKRTSISDIFEDEENNKKASRIFKYKILLSCGSALAAMDGFDAIAFSGKYIDAAPKLASWLISELKRIPVKEFSPQVFYFYERVEEIIADYYTVQNSN